MLLALKLLLVPCLVAVATLAGRRWGPRVGGWFTALPIVGGPVLSFYAIEQGEPFAASAAGGALAGLSAVAAFCVVYAWCARTTGWLGSGAAATAVFFLATGALHLATPGLALSAVLAVGAIALARRAIRPAAPSMPATVSTGGLPLRMAATAALVIVLTWLAEGLGPALSGLLTVFPIATGIMASFTHAQHGADALVAFFRGYLPALNAFALFCLVLALTFVALGWMGALAVALAVQLSAHGALLWWMTR